MFSELSDSESDIDLSDLIRHLDQNLSPVISNRQSAFVTGGGASVPGTSGSSPSISEQAAINQKILKWLNALGQRLDSTEKKRMLVPSQKSDQRFKKQNARARLKHMSHCHKVGQV